MKLSTKDVDSITVIRLEGSVLGGPDATALNDTLHTLVDKRKKKVVVDLAGVQTMNSSGLSMLIGALTTMRNAGGDLKLAAASKKIESLLVITKLSTVFDLHPTVQKAVGSFAK
ncbi:MAG: STAS domain-containing protein [Ignavibacteriae bacterium]|nr:STAS domain-containing protein [Ignavibacteria bacterium]MBI3364681.1 STAS domain-containing protein [Ignavibacteriota bacterium]